MYEANQNTEALKLNTEKEKQRDLHCPDIVTDSKSTLLGNMDRSTALFPSRIRAEYGC